MHVVNDFFSLVVYSPDNLSEFKIFFRASTTNKHHHQKPSNNIFNRYVCVWQGHTQC